ncbi:transcriptional regulator, XRE family (plasmid) [Candidatus Campylobacter infans]|jgi:antitoxin HicB|uniref:Transcriptional regulator, XRE family n=1 Tax=Candidatus Campylobacter infans TaxID=2561898 RepID=A0A7H9CJD6_9BACT|nr:helix-turn-helix domain-containing protein [Candidatus Campylobacter infans]QLI06230.1 transcriptional regulator, XRE family [Candidatus Campylobacter infans]
MKANELNSFDDFLKRDGTFDEIQSYAIKKVITYQLQNEMKNQKITKTKLAQLMNTSRASINRLLDPSNKSLTLNTLECATRVLGKQLSINII